MKKIIFLLAFASVFASCSSQGNAKIESVKDSTAYSVGVVLGTQLKYQLNDKFNSNNAIDAVNDVFSSKNEKIENLYQYFVAAQIASQIYYTVDSTLDIDAIVTGLKDAAEGKEFINADNAEQYITDYILKTTKEEADAFLAEADKIEGIKKTENGIRYIIENQGEGTISDSDKVSVNYTLFDYKGDTLDSSLKPGRQPLEVQLPSGVVPGFAQAIQLVGVGGKIKVWFPAELGYGQFPKGGIRPNQALKFDIEVLEKLSEEKNK